MTQPIWIRPLLVASIAVIATAGCGTDDRPPVETVECEDNRELICVDGTCSASRECGGETPYCLEGLGCVPCLPNEPVCSGGNEHVCGRDGQPAEQVEECLSGNCVDGECAPYCDMGDSKSYLGCQFVAVSTLNQDLDDAFFRDFAVVVGNPGLQAVSVEVHLKGVPVRLIELPPGGVEAIMLPMRQILSSAPESRIAQGEAYFIYSTKPVVAYQYNPLHYSVPDGAGIRYSYTNDASLLLPLHTFTGQYRVNTWPTSGVFWQPYQGALYEWSWSSGFAAVVALENNTAVTVKYANPDDTHTVELDKGDVYQLLSDRPETDSDPNHIDKIQECEDWGGLVAQSGTCPLLPDTDSDSETDSDSDSDSERVEICAGYCLLVSTDLTGIQIDANRPVGVFAGHNCTFMPFDQWACDHLEEMLLPVGAWGSKAIMTAPVHPDGISSGVVTAYYRVLADEDDTRISFVPAVAAPITLGAGEVYEFHTNQDFEISSDRRMYITQTLMGQAAIGSDVGDPAMGTGIPLAQSRGEYVFLVPETYTDNYVNMVAATGAEVYLDDELVASWTPIAGTAYSVARLRLEPGAHRATTEDNRGLTITSYGYAEFTSYLFPGGMNVVPVVL